MVTLRQNRSEHINKFWIRHNDINLEMTVDEIRDACLNVDNIWKDVKEFINMRKQEIKDEIKSEPYLIIGSSPIFINEDVVDIKDEEIKDFFKNPPNLGRNEYYPYGEYPSPSLYGLKINRKDFDAVELFRNGYYELRVYGEKILNSQSNFFITDILVAYIVNYFKVMMNLMKLLGIEQTIISYLSLFNISESKMLNRSNLPPHDEIKACPKEHLEFGPKPILSLENPDKIAEYFVERIWNAYELRLEEGKYFKDGKNVR